MPKRPLHTFLLCLAVIALSGVAVIALRAAGGDLGYGFLQGRGTVLA